MGFKLGLEKNLKDRKVSETLVIEQTSDGSQLGAMTSARRLLDRDVVMIVGFPTSQEALLESKLTKEKGILSISAAAGHADLGEMGPTVFSLGESMKSTAVETRKFIKSTFGSQQGLLVTNPYAVYSKNQEDAFVKEAKGKSDVSLTPVHFSKDLVLEESIMKDLKQGKFKYLVLTSYAAENAKLLEQLEKNKIDLPMIVNSSWMMGDVDYGRRYLVSRKSPTFIASDWSQTSRFPPAFEKAVKQKYGRSPTAEIAAGYDLGVISAKVLNGIKGQPTKESVLKEFVSQRCFSGTATGELCFDSKGGHALREITFRRFTPEGFFDDSSAAKK